MSAESGVGEGEGEGGFSVGDRLAEDEYQDAGDECHAAADDRHFRIPGGADQQASGDSGDGRGEIGDHVGNPLQLWPFSCGDGVGYQGAAGHEVAVPAKPEEEQRGNHGR
jgi:hypothetical protein